MTRIEAISLIISHSRSNVVFDQLGDHTSSFCTRDWFRKQHADNKRLFLRSMLHKVNDQVLFNLLPNRDTLMKG